MKSKYAVLGKEQLEQVGGWDDHLSTARQSASELAHDHEGETFYVVQLAASVSTTIVEKWDE